MARVARKSRLRIRPPFDPDITIALGAVGAAAMAAGAFPLVGRRIVGISGSSILTDSVLTSSGRIAQYDYTGSSSYAKDTVTQYDNARLKELITQINPDTEEGMKLLEILRSTAPERLKQNVKAAELVKQWLTPQEYKMLKQKHEVIVKSKKYKGREYHVPENPSERVSIYENGRRIAALCGIVYTDRETRQEFAYGDKLLTKIMALKNDEDYYIRNSNAYNYGDGELVGGAWVIHNHQAQREMNREQIGSQNRFGGVGHAVDNVSLKLNSRHNEENDSYSRYLRHMHLKRWLARRRRRH